MEFWHDITTEKSWNILKEIVRKFDFILIGGWAVYLWTRSLKSKDIDVAIEIKSLDYLKDNFDLRKNDNLKKYEIKKDNIDIDVYVEYYSKLIIPIEDLKDYATKIEGFKVLKKEALLILKQEAEKERELSEKGLKDKLDIISLVFKTDIDFNEYYNLIKKYKLMNFPTRLKHIINNFKDIKYLELNPREFKLKKKEILEKLKFTR